MMQGMTFPVPLPVILNQEEAEPATQKEQKETNELLEKEKEIQEQQLEVMGYDSRVQDKERRKDEKWEKLRNKHTKLWDKLGIFKYFKGLLGKIGLLAVGIAAIGGGFLSGLFNDLMELMLFAAVDPNGGLLGSFINALIPLFLNLAVMIVNVLVNLLPVLIKTFVKLIPTFLNAIIKIIDAVIDAIPLIIDAFIVATPLIIKALIKAIPKIVTGLMDGVLKVMETLAEKFPAFKPIADFISSIANAVKNLFSGTDDFPTRIKTFLGDILDSVMSGLGKLLTYLKDKFLEFYNSLGFLGKVIVVTLGLIAAVVIAILIWNGIMAIAALWPIIVGAALMLVGLLIAAFPFVIAALVIVGLIYLIDMIIENWDNIMSWIEGAWEGLTEWISEAWDSLIEMVMIGIDYLILIITWPWQLIKYVYKNWEKIKKLLEKGLDYVLNLFGSLVSTIKGKISGVFNWIKNFDLLGSIRNALSSAFDDIPGLGSIRAFFQDIANWLKENLPSWLTGESGPDKNIASLDQQIEKLAGTQVDDRVAEYVKQRAEQNQEITQSSLAKAGIEVNADMAKALEQLRIAYQQPQVVSDLSKLESVFDNRLNQLGQAVKSNAKGAVSLKSSNTLKKG